MSMGSWSIPAGLILLLVAGLLVPGGADDAFVRVETATIDVRHAPDGALWVRDATIGGCDSTVTLANDGRGGLIVREPSVVLRSALGAIASDGALHVPGAAHQPLRVELGPGADTLVADLSHGAPGSSIEYAGGDGFDTIDVRGDRSPELVHTGLSPHDGIIEVAGLRIAYRELEPVQLLGTGTLILNYPTTAATSIVMQDGGGPADGGTTVTATGFEYVIFGGYTTLTVRAGPGDNVITLLDIDSATTLTAIQIEGDAGDDSLSVDLNGNLSGWLAGGSLTYDGGSNTAGGDGLLVAGGSFASVTFDAVNANDGTIDLDGRTITYTGLEPIVDTTNAATKTFNFLPGAETITLDTGSVSGDGFNFVDSTLAESVTFTPPTATLNVNCGSGDDVLTVSALEGGPPVPYAVQLDGEAGTDTLVYSAPCAATVGPTTITEPGVMTVGHANFENVGTSPPASASCGVVRNLLWPPRGGLYPVSFSATGTACDNTVTVTVYSNEAEPPLAPDAIAPGGILRLRAERNYPGPGRVYLIVAEVAGTAVDCCTVVVPVLPVGAAILGVRSDASAAESFCLANAGAAPAGYAPILQYTLPAGP